MSAIDFGLLLAVMTFGWGLCLAVYRRWAQAVGWPMGKWQLKRPDWVWHTGVAAMALVCLFCVCRAFAGYPLSASVIPLFGAAWALFWIGFLRVGAQSALLLAPAGAVALLVHWLA